MFSRVDSRCVATLEPAPFDGQVPMSASSTGRMSVGWSASQATAGPVSRVRLPAPAPIVVHGGRAGVTGPAISTPIFRLRASDGLPLSWLVGRPASPTKILVGACLGVPGISPVLRFRDVADVHSDRFCSKWFDSTAPTKNYGTVDSLELGRTGDRGPECLTRFSLRVTWALASLGRPLWSCMTSSMLVMEKGPKSCLAARRGASTFDQGDFRHLGRPLERSRDVVQSLLLSPIWRGPGRRPCAGLSLDDVSLRPSEGRWLRAAWGFNSPAPLPSWAVGLVPAAYVRPGFPESGAPLLWAQSTLWSVGGPLGKSAGSIPASAVEYGGRWCARGLLAMRMTCGVVRKQPTRRRLGRPWGICPRYVTVLVHKAVDRYKGKGGSIPPASTMKSSAVGP